MNYCINIHPPLYTIQWYGNLRKDTDYFNKGDINDLFIKQYHYVELSRVKKCIAKFCINKVLILILYILLFNVLVLNVLVLNLLKLSKLIINVLVLTLCMGTVDFCCVIKC